MLKRLLRTRLFVLTVSGAVLLFVGFLAMVTGGHDAVQTAAATDWGLSFQKEGEPPITNVTEEYLSQYDAVFLGDEAQNSLNTMFQQRFL